MTTGSRTDDAWWPVTLSRELEAFATDHRPHGTLTGGAEGVAPNGYRLAVTCPCGIVFERWVTPLEAPEALFALLAALI